LKTFDIHKYDGLLLPPGFTKMASTEAGRKLIMECCNGVGSKVGWFNRLFYHFIPNTVYFLNVTACSDLHDFGSTYPNHFVNRIEAIKHLKANNLQLRENLETYIDTHTKNEWLLNARLKRAINYYSAVRIAGDKSFFNNKTFDDDSPLRDLQLKGMLFK